MNLRRCLSLFFCLALVTFPTLLRAQTAGDVEARRAQLQAELEKEEAAIAIQTKLLQAKQRDTATAAGEVALLKSQIAQAQVDIKAKKVAIARLDDDIALRQTKIETLADKIRHGQESLGELLRHTRDIESLSFVEIILQGDRLSEIFHNVDDFAAVQASLGRAFAEMRTAQGEAHQEQLVLQEKKDATVDAQKAIEQQQKVIQKRESEQKVVLAINKNQETAYRKVLQERQKRAAQIRSALFSLRDTAAIPFGKALELAQAAQQKTGVRPAFLLAILTQESALGENVGSCYLVNPTTGSGTSAKSGRAVAKVMKPARDVSPFLALVKSLGGDPFNTLVSCPQAVGWGGAMGPAQFIPSTWALLADRISQTLGVNLANPWQPEHAFVASALYLSDLGAVSSSYSSELRAACKYYGSGGSSCTYGQQVMAKASDIQLNMIDPLQKADFLLDSGH